MVGVMDTLMPTLILLMQNSAKVCLHFMLTFGFLCSSGYVTCPARLCVCHYKSQ